MLRIIVTKRKLSVEVQYSGNNHFTLGILVPVALFNRYVTWHAFTVVVTVIIRNEHLQFRLVQKVKKNNYFQKFIPFRMLRCHCASIEPTRPVIHRAQSKEVKRSGCTRIFFYTCSIHYNIAAPNFRKMIFFSSQLDLGTTLGSRSFTSSRSTTENYQTIINMNRKYFSEFETRFENDF